MTTIRVQRVSISIMIALFIATLTFMTAQAATTVLSEQGNRFFYWYGPTINNASMLGCRTSGGVTNYNCKWKNQVSSNESMYFWGANQPNVTKWYAYVPSDADVAVNYSASYYDRSNVKRWWYVTLNQGDPNKWGQFIYLGFNDDSINTTANLYLSNKCVPGWSCSTIYWVFWDDVKFDY